MKKNSIAERCFVFVSPVSGERVFFCGKHYMEVENQRFFVGGGGLEYFFLWSLNKRPAIISAPCAFLLRIVTSHGCDSSWTRAHTGTKNKNKNDSTSVVFNFFVDNKLAAFGKSRRLVL